MREPDVKIRRREIEIDKEVLFAGRFLLVKIGSGMPLINSLVEASKSYGVASSYFKEIVKDIETGSPMEEALERAMTYCPSKKFQKILFQITNALKIGIDVTKSLEAVLDQITNEQLLEIKKYGKKLNSVTLFYMLLAVVLPSLGMTMLIVLISFSPITIDLTLFIVILFFLAIIQFFFITIFRTIRPKVNI